MKRVARLDFHAHVDSRSWTEGWHFVLGRILNHGGGLWRRDDGREQVDHEQRAVSDGLAPLRSAIYGGMLSLTHVDASMTRF